MAAPFQILLVTPDADSRTIYDTALRARGFEVWIAPSCEDGLAAVQHRLPDLLVLEADAGTPCATELLNIFQGRDVPILALTCKAGVEESARFLSLGYTGVIVKPAGPIEMLERVELVRAARR